VLQQLSSLQLSVSVDPKLHRTNTTGWKKRLKQQQRQQEASNMQSDLLAVTTAAGCLTQLKQLQLIITPYAGKAFPDVGVRSLIALSALTQLLSLSLSYSVLSSGSGLSRLSGLSALTQLSVKETGQLSNRGTRKTWLDPNKESAVSALRGVWPALQHLRQLKICSPYLTSAGVVQQLSGLQGGQLRVLDVSGCVMRFEGVVAAKLAQLTALQVGHRKLSWHSKCRAICAILCTLPIL
jgi:hypothetical protein